MLPLLPGGKPFVLAASPPPAPPLPQQPPPTLPTPPRAAPPPPRPHPAAARRPPPAAAPRTAAPQLFETGAKPRVGHCPFATLAYLEARSARTHSWRICRAALAGQEARAARAHPPSPILNMTALALSSSSVPRRTGFFSEAPTGARNRGRKEDTIHTCRGYPSGGSVGRSTETSAKRSAPSWRRTLPTWVVASGIEKNVQGVNTLGNVLLTPCREPRAVLTLY